jgi:hypothetical protein
MAICGAVPALAGLLVAVATTRRPDTEQARPDELNSAKPLDASDQIGFTPGAARQCVCRPLDQKAVGRRLAGQLEVRSKASALPSLGRGSEGMTMGGRG